ncbi:Heat shock 70 kDa protein 14, partial [Caligus rogercresseyi]
MRVDSAFGIHDGRSYVVANDDGDRTTPAAITYLNGGSEVVVGLASKNSRFRSAKSTVQRNKRLFFES